MKLIRSITVLAVAATSLIGVTVPAQAATVNARATITMSTNEGPRTVDVKVTRLAAKSPVTVNWGDGEQEVLTSTCTVTRAKKYPAKCSATTTKVYEEAGDYLLTLSQNGTVLKSANVWVVLPPETGNPAPEPEPTPVPDPAPEEPGVAAWEIDMLNQVNTLRASVGAGPVALCAPLSRAATKHSQDMASRDYFSHATPEGVGPGERINAEGYFGGWGENIAAGYRSVPEVMQGWINSPGHYANLVNASYTHIGFGKAEGGSYGLYWTQNFGYRGTC